MSCHKQKSYFPSKYITNASHRTCLCFQVQVFLVYQCILQRAARVKGMILIGAVSFSAGKNFFLKHHRCGGAFFFFCVRPKRLTVMTEGSFSPVHHPLSLSSLRLPLQLTPPHFFASSNLPSLSFLEPVTLNFHRQPASSYTSVLKLWPQTRSLSIILCGRQDDDLLMRSAS